MRDCLVCKRIGDIKKNKNPYFVKELKTGYVLLEDNQLYQGYTLFLCKKHVTELHKLDDKFKLQFLQEMSQVAKAVWDVFNPAELNYALLGNKEPHLHWHIIPRYKEDPAFTEPIWGLKKKQKNANLSKEEIDKLKKELIKQIPK